MGKPQKESEMKRVMPPNNTMGRALFAWDKTLLDSSTERANFVAFCVANNITQVLLHFYQWIGAGNWNSTNQANLVALLTSLHGAAIKVKGLIGGEDYAVNQQWVRRNIVDAVSAFNASSPAHQFDGLVYDCEYWISPQTYDPAVYIPAYCRLIEATRNHLDLPVGVFVQRSLLDGTRDAIDFRGLNDVDGAHLLAAADEIYVGSYDNQAEPHDGYPGQIAMIRPWVERADSDGLGTLVWGCSETLDLQPSWITYYGSTKAVMEVQHALIAAELSSPSGSSFVGQAVHCYSSYRTM
jgi:hypothetical protein